MLPIQLDDGDFEKDPEYKKLYTDYLLARTNLISYIEKAVLLAETKRSEG